MDGDVWYTLFMQQLMSAIASGGPFAVGPISGPESGEHFFDFPFGPSKPRDSAEQAKIQEQVRRERAETVAKDYLLQFAAPDSIEEALCPVPAELPILRLYALTPRQSAEMSRQRNSFLGFKTQKFRKELEQFDDDIVGRKEAMIKFGDYCLSANIGSDWFKITGTYPLEYATPSRIYFNGNTSHYTWGNGPNPFGVEVSFRDKSSSKVGPDRDDRNGVESKSEGADERKSDKPDGETKKRAGEVLHTTATPGRSLKGTEQKGVSLTAEPAKHSTSKSISLSAADPQTKAVLGAMAESTIFSDKRKFFSTKVVDTGSKPTSEPSSSSVKEKRKSITDSDIEPEHDAAYEMACIWNGYFSQRKKDKFFANGNPFAKTDVPAMRQEEDMKEEEIGTKSSSAFECAPDTGDSYHKGEKKDQNATISPGPQNITLSSAKSGHAGGSGDEVSTPAKFALSASGKRALAKVLTQLSSRGPPAAIPRFGVTSVGLGLASSSIDLKKQSTPAAKQTFKEDKQDKNASIEPSAPEAKSRWTDEDSIAVMKKLCYGSGGSQQNPEEEEVKRKDDGKGGNRAKAKNASTLQPGKVSARKIDGRPDSGKRKERESASGGSSSEPAPEKKKLAGSGLNAVAKAKKGNSPKKSTSGGNGSKPAAKTSIPALAPPPKKEKKVVVHVWKKPYMPSMRPDRDCWHGRVYT